MIYHVSFRDKDDAAYPQSKFRRSLFVESGSEVSSASVKELVDKFSGGNFEESTIEVESCRTFEPDELRQYVTIFRFPTQ
jgi:hypothetical protein